LNFSAFIEILPEKNLPAWTAGFFVLGENHLKRIKKKYLPKIIRLIFFMIFQTQTGK